MRISELSQRTGVSADRLRHYHGLGLIKAKRSSAGYRDFAEASVRDVTFIAKCREVGVPLRKIGKIIPGYRAGTLTFDDMIELMGDQVEQVDQQIRELRKLRRELLQAKEWFRTRKKDGLHHRKASK
jgi:DNA-binding transcriptional MerR regulator